MAQVSFEDKTVVVTGAGNGLGKSYALEFAKRGANVVVNDLGGSVDGSGSGSSPADEVVEEIKNNGGNAVANYDSVATKEGGEAIVNSAIEAYGSLHAVVNNAGILRDKSFAKMTEEDFNAVLDVHLRELSLLSTSFYSYERKWIWTICKCSFSIRIIWKFWTVKLWGCKNGYCGLTNIIAIEGAKYNINANVLAPNATTRMTEELFGEEFGKLFKVEQVTPLVVYLASEACETTHEIFSAGAGRYARIGINTHVGYVNPDATADDISENIEDIRTIKDGIYPMNNADELVIIQKALQGE